MREDESKVSNTTVSGTTSFSYNSSSNAKFGGLIERTPMKQLLKEMSFLMDYVYSIAPSYNAVYIVMTVIRLLQLMGASFCTGYDKFWTNDDNARSTISIISIIFYLIPPNKRAAGGEIFSIIYDVLVFILLVMLVASAKYYQINASLPKQIPIFISFYFATFGYYLHNCVAEFAFSALGSLIFADGEREVLKTVLLLIFAILLSGLYIYVYLCIASRTLTFRGDSLQTVSSQTSNILFLSTTIVTILASFTDSNDCPKIVTLVFLILAGLVYFASIFAVFYYGGIINDFCACAYTASCVAGGIMSIAVGISIMLDAPGKMHYLIIFVILWVVAFVAFYFIYSMIKTRRLQLLDQILDDESNYDKIKSINQFVNLQVEGFKVAHPICINWTFSKYGVERWPKSSIVWYIYAKFTAIYPEETQTLWWVFRSIVTNKVKGSATKTVKEQSMSIARQREPNLSPDLKNKLNSINKHLTSTKHKLRHVWDLAIQGDISGMESATKKAIKEIEQSDAEIMHILRQFPNNRFVTRQYARFCKELKANNVQYMEMIDKTRQLQRGISVNKDQAHEFGMATFKNLPDKANPTPDNQIIQNMVNESGTTSMNELDGDEENANEADESIVLVNRIDSLVIPATRWSIIINLAMFIVIFAAPIIIILIFLSSYTSDLVEPLSHIYYISIVRVFTFMITAFSEQRIYELLGAFEPATPSSSTLPSSVGSSWNTVEQLRYILSRTSVYLQYIELFRSFENANEHVKQAQSLIFDSNLEYQYYNGLTPSAKNVTIQIALSDFILLQNEILADDAKIDHSITNTSIVLNPLMNTDIIADTLTEALEHMISWEDEQNSNYQFIFDVVIICVIIFVILAFLGVLVAEIIWINNNKDQAYRCLTSLPKNAVSTVAENLRVLKKETENSSTIMGNSEMSKQEDSILKIFVTGATSSSSKIVDAILLTICCVVIIVMHIGCTVILGQKAKELSKYIRSNSPHLNYLAGTIAYEFGSLTSIIMMLVNGDPEYNVYLATKQNLVPLYEQRILQARTYYNSARFGGSSADDPPYSGFSSGVEEARSKITCLNEYEVVDDFLNGAQCYSPDVVYILLEGIWESRVVPYNNSDAEQLPWNELSMHQQIWSMMIFPIYDALFQPMMLELVSTMTVDMDDLLVATYPGVIAMLIVGLIFIILDIIELVSIEHHIKGVLKLLLHVPASTVMSTPKIMSILSGNFSKNRNDMSTRSEEFFQEVVMNLTDVVITTDNEKKITAVNKSFNRIFNREEESVIGLTMTEFFNEKFKGDFKKIIDGVTNSQISETTVTFSREGEELTLEANSIPIGTVNVVVFCDITQTVRYNNLINEEKTKSDILLSSILPPSLVKRVQAGEKNISFAVQSATIVFMDIVSFTPWCGSLPADKVMMTLNYLFKLFDGRLNNYETMTKIKCIGDCYMAAGGVFSEVNQPTEHAKEVVSFGLDALEAIEELNKELNENLQIRVGINSGGPIVAGVLGIGKPTFEILGPAINMAQQMEHHGVPMKVHVSRSVYELIYGDTFIIKERGSVEVKNGSVITYLVSRKK